MTTKDGIKSRIFASFWIILLPLFVIEVLSICQSEFAFRDSSCVLTSTNQIKCWGVNSFGQLGYGDSVSRGNESSQMGSYLPYVNLGGGFVINLNVGEDHACAQFSGDLFIYLFHNENVILLYKYRFFNYLLGC